MPPELEERIVREARRRGESKSSVVIETLQRALRPSRRRRGSLKRFFGGMSREDYKALLGSVSTQRRVDSELWP